MRFASTKKLCEESIVPRVHPISNRSSEKPLVWKKQLIRGDQALGDDRSGAFKSEMMSSRGGDTQREGLSQYTRFEHRASITERYAWVLHNNSTGKIEEMKVYH